jgi:hypothetical protein
MQFVVPQFIDIEPKIIGPITPRQFIILIITGAFIFVAYKLSDFSLFLIEAVVIFGIGGTSAFLKINGQPVHYFLLNLTQTLKRPMLRIWRKDFIMAKELVVKEKGKIAPVAVPRKTLSNARLSNLSILVDTGGLYHEEV